MPTHIPVKTCAGRAEPLDAASSRTAAHAQSWTAEAKAILMLSLLAAAIIYVVAYVIVWAYA
jgi:hypothetical protein